MEETLAQKACFKNGRKGYIHIVRDVIDKAHLKFNTPPAFTYKAVEGWLELIHPDIKVPRTTIIASLTRMADPANGELEIVELGRGNVTTKYRRIA